MVIECRTPVDSEDERDMSLGDLHAQVEEYLDMACTALRRKRHGDAKAHLDAAAAIWFEYGSILAAYSGTALPDRVAAVDEKVRRLSPPGPPRSRARQMLVKETSCINENRVWRKQMPAVVPDERLAVARGSG